MYVTHGKMIASTLQTFVGRVMPLLFNTVSRFVIAFLPRSKRLLISWLQSLSAVIFGAQENKICHCFHFSLFYLPWNDETRCHDPGVLNVEFEDRLFTLVYHPRQEALLVLHFLPLEWYHLHIWGCWYFLQSWFQLVNHLAIHFRLSLFSCTAERGFLLSPVVNCSCFFLSCCLIYE